jgi:hypothetical protein
VVGEGNTVSKRFTNAWLIVACATCAGASYGADISTEPRADLRVEQNDNFNLIPGGSPDSDVYGYVADLAVLFDFRTPRGGTELRPRIKLQEFPDRQDLEKVEWFLDMHSDYKSERNRFLFDGNASRQDLYSSETPSGDDPGGGDNGDSGQIVIGEVRTWLSARPTFEHRFTERTSVGISAQFQAARYDADEGPATKTDYDYSVLDAYLSWALNPTTDFSVGAYGSSYEAQDNSEDTDAVGGNVGVVHRWNTTDGIVATLYYERNDITEFVPVLNKETTSDVGGELTAYRKLEVSEWRFTVGRSFIPTGDSGKASLDHVGAQYERSLSQRLSLRAAARYDSRNALGTTTISTGDDRDYARADLSLKWFVSPTWYIGGGYAYIWEDRQQAISDASNNKFYLNFGYRALSRGDIEPPNWDRL